MRLWHTFVNYFSISLSYFSKLSRMPYYYRAFAIIAWTTLSSALLEHTTLLYADAQRLR